MHSTTEQHPWPHDITHTFKLKLEGLFLKKWEGKYLMSNFKGSTDQCKPKIPLNSNEIYLVIATLFNYDIYYSKQ